MNDETESPEVTLSVTLSFCEIVIVVKEEGKEGRGRREEKEGTDGVQPVCKGDDIGGEGGESRDVATGFDEGGRKNVEREEGGGSRGGGGRE